MWPLPCPWALPLSVVVGRASGELRSANGIVSGEKDVFSIQYVAIFHYICTMQ